MPLIQMPDWSEKPTTKTRQLQAEMCGTEEQCWLQEGEQLRGGGREHEGYLDPILNEEYGEQGPLRDLDWDRY